MVYAFERRVESGQIKTVADAVMELVDAEHCGLSAGRFGHSNDTMRKNG